MERSRAFSDAFIACKAVGLRQQGFFGAAMLPMSELEYTGVTALLDQLEPRFHVRVEAPLKAVRAG